MTPRPFMLVFVRFHDTCPIRTKINPFVCRRPQGIVPCADRPSPASPYRERNLGGDIRPFPRFTVDRRGASEQLEGSASSAQSEASGRCFVGFETGSPIPGVNAEYIAIQGQLQEYLFALAVTARVGERFLRDADGRSFPLRRDICVDGVLAELHVGTVRGLDFLNQVRHRRGKTARHKQGGRKAADRPPQFLDCLVEKSHRRVEATPIQARFRLLVPKGLQSCSSRNRVPHATF